MDEEGRSEARTNPKGALVFVIAVVVVAVVVIGLLVTAGSGDEACADWEAAKAEWVESYPPIQRETQADLADFQGWVELNGERIERPEGC